MTRSICLRLAYDGTDFVGWQRQATGPSIQEAVERALAGACDVPRLVVEGASRTDAGVHARLQIASAIVETRLSDDEIRRAMNARLPSSIAVLGVATMPDGFHARFWSVFKRYAYRIESAPRRSPIGRSYAMWTPRSLDVARMRLGARHLLGRHDFAAFASAGSPREHTVRVVQHLHVFQRRNITTIAVQGTGFLYNQVRAFAGTLLLVGQGRLAPEEVAKIRDSRDRRLAGPTAPPEGLHLVRVQIGEGPGRKPSLFEDEADGVDRGSGALRDGVGSQDGQPGVSC
ncbi:MAG: tRNA pseudouridine(38-40) synthase TruA [Planctomycetes bacterium]|nr:tRNA pseudouridine(38-40) synthase TruA [Planctomycetota bacterium]